MNNTWNDQKDTYWNDLTKLFTKDNVACKHLLSTCYNKLDMEGFLNEIAYLILCLDKHENNLCVSAATACNYFKMLKSNTEQIPEISNLLINQFMIDPEFLNHFQNKVFEHNIKYSNNKTI